MSRRPAYILPALVVLLLAGCEQPQLADQPKYETYEAAPAWENGQSARHPPPGTVARDAAVEPPPKQLPMALDRALLERGRKRFGIFCTPCHGEAGYADGMVVQRGFPEPPSFHTERLRNAPLAHFYNVITEGFGVMYAYADRVPPRDRWAIAAYIRALQLSQNVPVDTLSAEQRQQLEAQP